MSEDRTKRKKLERRAGDRRKENIPVNLDRRKNSDRRSGFDRRSKPV